MRKILAVVLFASVIGATSAQAQTTTYGNRGAFDTAAGLTTIETFESCGGSSGNSLAVNQSVSAGGGACSGIAPGITFTPDTGGNFYIAPPGQSANPTLALGIDLPGSGGNVITFASGVNSFAADFNQNFGGGNQRGTPVLFTLFTFSLGGAVLDTFDFSVASGISTFFGLTSTNEIGKVRVFSKENGYAVIDNVSFGKISGGVPEPTTWAMMMLGLTVVGTAMRRRRAGGALARTA